MTQVWISTGEECYWLWASLRKKSVCTFPPLASCRLSWIDLTGKSGVVPHPNQTPVVSNRRFVPNGCDLHPTTMYLCNYVFASKYNVTSNQQQCILLCQTNRQSDSHLSCSYTLKQFQKQASMWPRTKILCWKFVWLKCIFSCGAKPCHCT